MRRSITALNRRNTRTKTRATVGSGYLFHLMVSCLASIVILVACVGGSADAIGVRPPYAAQIGGGTKFGKPWRVWAFGKPNNQLCVDAFSIVGSLAREDQACERPQLTDEGCVLPLKAYLGASRKSFVLRVFVTHKDVGELEFAIQTAKASIEEKRLATKRLSGEISRKAHIHQAVSFAILILPIEARIVRCGAIRRA